MLRDRFARLDWAGWVASPGSRCAPLVLAFRDLEAPNQVLLDERSAAHWALGAAIASGKPAFAVCTSGTAALNFGPAVAEAFYQQVALLVVTADRPAALIDNGQGQSIRQERIFDDHLVGKGLLDQSEHRSERGPIVLIVHARSVGRHLDGNETRHVKEHLGNGIVVQAFPLWVGGGTVVSYLDPTTTKTLESTNKKADQRMNDAE